MNKLVASVLVGAFICVTAFGPATAANRKAQDMVAGLQKDQATLLAKFPSLAQVDGFIRAECAAQNKGKLATDDFCGCASAVTMGLWRSGADPKMLPRLNEYLKSPTEVAAKEFLQYQGPELYRPICTEASKR
jgi:hypothetical protein